MWEWLSKYAPFIGIALSPFMALLLIFIARVVIKHTFAKMPEGLIKKILFIRW